MKKTSRLRLHSETLLRLDSPMLRVAAGSDTVVACSGLQTICNPSGDSACESACLACPSIVPTIEH
ncbi:MAG: hypothetical protein DMF53_03725 [Acidobacteria bacterium]|nr:MAG: hypothetical protein DMF53_03725 [Acidobacteriota bacterium]